ncbi:MAG TPA: M24 family metallopeptidase, partial [Chlamydiales bacterium]|nr:M24 family metallopeptidase [Chlamydiales bacterium]
AGPTKLKKNEIVLIDIGVIVDGYNSDMTRMVYFGKVDPKLQEIAHVVQVAQASAFKVCKEGATTAELDTIARKIIEKAGFAKFFTHGLGHGVGLDIHELPIVKKDPAIPERVLKTGMCLTIEPGIYLPGLGGVRIEDTVVVLKNGATNLIQRPHQPIHIDL